MADIITPYLVSAAEKCQICSEKVSELTFCCEKVSELTFCGKKVSELKFCGEKTSFSSLAAMKSFLHVLI